MTTPLDPLIYEHDTAEEAEAVDAALRVRVERAMNSMKPRVPHEQVMREARAIIDAEKESTE